MLVPLVLFLDYTSTWCGSPVGYSIEQCSLALLICSDCKLNTFAQDIPGSVVDPFSGE